MTSLCADDVMTSYNKPAICEDLDLQVAIFLIALLDWLVINWKKY